MTKQPAPTKGDIRSPTRLIFQQNPPNPVRSIWTGVFGSRGLLPSKIPGLNSRRYVLVQIINNSIIKTLEKSKIALIIGDANANTVVKCVVPDDDYVMPLKR